MATIEIDGDEFTVTDEEQAEYDRLVEAGIYPMTALQMAAGGFEDIETVSKEPTP